MDVGCMTIEDVKKYIEMTYKIKPAKVEKVWSQANFRDSFPGAGSSVKYFPGNPYWSTYDPTNADMADTFYLGEFELRWYMYNDPTGTDYGMYLTQWIVTEFDFAGDTYANDFQNIFRYDTDQAGTSFGSPWPTQKRNEVQYLTKSDFPSFGLHTGLQLYGQVVESSFSINMQIFWKGFRIYFR